MTTDTEFKGRKGFTREQYATLARKWRDDGQGMTLGDFIGSASGPHFGGDYIMVTWCGMTLGIEPDGYCHS